MRVVPLHGPEGVVCDRCSLAERPLERMRGLLGRAGLEPGEALLLRPAASVHTFFMRFSLDVVFLASDGAVLKVVPALAPWRTASSRGAKAVLELAAGAAERAGITPGQRLTLPPKRPSGLDKLLGLPRLFAARR